MAEEVPTLDLLRPALGLHAGIPENGWGPASCLTWPTAGHPAVKKNFDPDAA